MNRCSRRLHADGQLRCPPGSATTELAILNLPISAEDAVIRHNELRNLIAAQVHRDWALPNSTFSIVASKLLGFGFNTYKAIGLLTGRLICQIFCNNWVLAPLQSGMGLLRQDGLGADFRDYRRLAPWDRRRPGLRPNVLRCRRDASGPRGAAGT